MKEKFERDTSKIELGLSLKDLAKLKDLVETENTIISNLEKFEKSRFFAKKSLKRGELLFNEGDIDSNIYILKKGNISVEKYTNSLKNDTKKLAILGKGSIVGEQSLSFPDDTKKSLIKALNDVEFLSIDAKKDFKEFMSESVDLGMLILMRIISLTNERLNNTNEELTYLFEFNNKMASLSGVSRGIFAEIFEFINSMIFSDYTIFLKSHVVLDDTFTVFYDSRINSSVGNFITLEGDFVPYEHQELNILPTDKLFVTKLNIGKKILGYVIYGRQVSEYSENHKKILGNFTMNLCAIIKQFDVQEDEKARLKLDQQKF